MGFRWKCWRHNGGIGGDVRGTIASFSVRNTGEWFGEMGILEDNGGIFIIMGFRWKYDMYNRKNWISVRCNWRLDKGNINM